MAEGICRHFHNELIAAYSAGISKHGLNPLAVKVMREINIDISAYYSKTVVDLDQQTFDYVVTLCGHAHETCPVFYGDTFLIHHRFDDPPKLTVNVATEEEALVHYRRVRDEIKQYILTFPKSLLGQ